MRRRSGSRRSFGRIVLAALLVLLAAPPLWLLALNFMSPPPTPLMLIRRVEGHAIDYRPVPLDAVSPHLRRAVVAAEDNLFCSHAGLDWTALRTQFERAIEGDRPRGASTISMQTAKNLFLWPDRHLLRKALELWLTPQLELLLDKRRILALYLSIAEFGPGIYGAEAAARRHFGIAAAALDQEQAARLALMLPAPLERTPERIAPDAVRRILTRIDQLGPALDCVG
ncbi:MAG: monofunctional biosynthetic peptidoglycan transglycosylase [Geminicoccaceae bacterium]|nr:monofunctional biosynthetic peptidoglycan transglycosylase [Geminicoccaceae bacterium]